MAELKPCPFCGTTEHLFIESREERSPDHISDHVVCGMCGVIHIKDDCLGWNNRPTEKARGEEVLELVCATICGDCRFGKGRVEFSESDNMWLHIDDEENGLGHKCEASDFRQAYTEQYGGK